jgi:uncharacterized protein (DUF779 family)
MSNSDARSGSIQKTSSELYDRTLYVNGIKLLIGGEQPDVNHSEVPDEWAYKVAQSIKLVMDPLAAGIAVLDQERMKEVLAGDEGTWHEREGGTVQRILKGRGDEYPLNPLKDSNEGDLDGEYGSGTEDLLVGAINDMVWYQNNSHGDVNATGDDDVTELFEHIMHTIHLFGVRGAVDGSLKDLNYTTEFGDEHEQDDSGWKNSELYLAVEEANYNGVFTPGYMPETFADWNGLDFSMAAKEYTYLLNFSMWEMGKEFWTDKNADGEGTLAPEWSDSASTPAGVLSGNPLGYALFNTYFAPVLSKPNFETLRSMFQDNDGGVSGYVSSTLLAGSDQIIGNKFSDLIVGYAGDDLLNGGAGNDSLDGGAGQDTATYAGSLSDYLVLNASTGKTLVVDIVAGRDGKDSLQNVENIRFGTETLTLAAALVEPADADNSAFQAYRFYNTETGSHFFTTSIAERNSVIETLDMLSFEGNAFDSNVTEANGTAVFRFYNKDKGVHFYTAAADEAASVRLNAGFRDEGISYYASTDDSNGGTALYRFYNTQNDSHFYTVSEAERDNIINTIGHYKYEDVAFYVDAA